MGPWLSIGVAQPNFPLTKKQVLGSHHDCYNLGYYCDKKSHHLKLKAFRKYPFSKTICTVNYKRYANCKTFESGDIIRIEVNFDKMEITFYNNDIMQGGPVGFSTEEAELYPTVALGAECKVRILI